MSSSTKRFVYKRLKKPHAEIHLLVIEQIHNSDAEMEVSCQLETVALESAPQYTALSYEWGDPDVEVDIKLNGDVFLGQIQPILIP